MLEHVDQHYEVQRNLSNLATLKAFYAMGLPIQELEKYDVQPLEPYYPGFSQEIDSVHIVRVVCQTLLPEAACFKNSLFIENDFHYNGTLEEEEFKKFEACLLEQFTLLKPSQLTNSDLDCLFLEDDFSQIDFELIKKQVQEMQYSGYEKTPLISEGSKIIDESGMELQFELSKDKQKLILFYEYGFFAYSASIIALFLLYLVKQMKQLKG